MSLWFGLTLLHKPLGEINKTLLSSEWYKAFPVWQQHLNTNYRYSDWGHKMSYLAGYHTREVKEYVGETILSLRHFSSGRALCIHINVCIKQLYLPPLPPADWSFNPPIIPKWAVTLSHFPFPWTTGHLITTGSPCSWLSRPCVTLHVCLWGRWHPRPGKGEISP